MSDFNADARAQLKALHPGLFPPSAEDQEIARHVDAVARALTAARDAYHAVPCGDGLRWIGPSTYAQAEMVVRAVYAAEKARTEAGAE